MRKQWVMKCRALPIQLLHDEVTDWGLGRKNYEGAGAGYQVGWGVGLVDD